MLQTNVLHLRKKDWEDLIPRELQKIGEIIKQSNHPDAVISVMFTTHSAMEEAMKYVEWYG